MSNAAFPDNGVPARFSKMTETVGKFNVVAGALTKMKLRPRIFNEHQEESNGIVGTVDAATYVGQIFKASQDNINGMMITAASAEAVTMLDDFEAYADSAALQLAWPLGGGGINPATLETTTVKVGAQGMRIMLDDLDSWTKTIAAADMTGATLHLWYQQSKEINKAAVRFFIGDGTNTKSVQLSIAQKDVWQNFPIQEAAFTEDQVGVTNVAAITQIGFRVTNTDGGEFGYIDEIRWQAPPGTLRMKLWDLGASLPVGDGTEDLTVIGTQYTTLGDLGIGGTTFAQIDLSLLGGKRLYDCVPFIAGAATENPANAVLTVGNYYAVTFHYVDTITSIYGEIATDRYINGYSFTAPVATNILTKTGATHDAQFVVFSTGEVYINDVELKFDATAGPDARFHIWIEDQNCQVSDVIALNESGFGLEHKENLVQRPARMPKGGRCEAYYNDDPLNGISTVAMQTRYRYIPQVANG